METNYKLYGYTTSPLQRTILETFSRRECLLPNLYVGSINRDSIAHALTCGIAAEQIVSYLQSHAHPKIRHRVPVVPEVVADQIRLWEVDMLRIRSFQSVLYDDFPSPDVFRRAVSFARRRGVYLWDDGQRRMIAKVEGHDDIRSFVKSIKGQ